MEENLSELIQRAYPEGTIYRRNEEALRDEKRDSLLQSVLKTVSRKRHLDWSVEPFVKQPYCIMITKLGHPSFDEWVREMNKSAKIKWIKRNNSPYPVLILKVSRVANYYDIIYNHWVLNDNTGFPRADWNMTPGEEWLKSEEILKIHLHGNGFQCLPDHLAAEKTPLVKETDDDRLPAEEPGIPDDAQHVPWVHATVHRCLFMRWS